MAAVATVAIIGIAVGIIVGTNQNGKKWAKNKINGHQKIIWLNVFLSMTKSSKQLW